MLRQKPNWYAGRCQPGSQSIPGTTQAKARHDRMTHNCTEAKLSALHVPQPDSKGRGPATIPFPGHPTRCERKARAKQEPRLQPQRYSCHRPPQRTGSHKMLPVWSAGQAQPHTRQRGRQSNFQAMCRTFVLFRSWGKGRPGQRRRR